MDEAKRELVRAWFIKARNDLTAARAIGILPNGPLDTAIYHFQQAAEKVVKGFLALHDNRLERSHDIKRLVELVARHEPKFMDHEEAAITLTPYATAYRCPGESAVLEPSRKEFDEALRLANEMMSFVFSLSPMDVL